MRFGISTICLLLFLALPAFGTSSNPGEAATPSTAETDKKNKETFDKALKDTSVTGLVTAVSGLTAAQRAELPEGQLFNALARLPAPVREELLRNEPALASRLPPAQQQYLLNAQMRATGQTGASIQDPNQGSGQGGQAPAPAAAAPSPSPSPAATTPAQTTSTEPPKPEGEGDKKPKIEVPQPKERETNAFLADALKQKQEETDLSFLAGALAAINQGVNSKAASEMAAQGGASQAIIDQILQLGKNTIGSAQLAATNSGVGGASGSVGYGVAPSDRLVNSLEAPARAIAAPKKKAVPQFLDQSYARGVAAANQERASTEGGRVRVIDGGYGSGGEGSGTVQLRNGSSSSDAFGSASGHRGANP